MGLDRSASSRRVEVVIQELRIEQVAVRSRTNHMVLMDARVDFSSKQRRSPDLVCASVAVDDENVSRLKRPTVQLIWRHLEVAGVGNTDGVTAHVRHS